MFLAYPNKALLKCIFVWRKICQNLHIYHPLIAILFYKCHKKIAIKLPLPLDNWLFIFCLFVNLIIAVAFTVLMQSDCLDKRFYAVNSNACQNFKSLVFSFLQKIIIAAVTSALAVGLTMTFIWLFTKNYL